MEYKGYQYSVCNKKNKSYIMLRRDNVFIRATKHYDHVDDAIKEANRVVDNILAGLPVSAAEKKASYKGLRDWLTI